MNAKQVTELGDQLAVAYGRLDAALSDAFRAEEAVIEAKMSLDDARTAIFNSISDPKSLGSNEAAREARLAELTSPIVTAVRATESESRRCRHLLELARERLAHERARLRLAEVAAGIVRNF